MKKINQILLVFSLFLLLLLPWIKQPSLVQAQQHIEFNSNTLDELNPLTIYSTEKQEFYDGDNFSISMTINRALTFLFPLAGLILFVLITWGGFEMMLGAASKKNLDAGKQRVTAAIIGFLLLFSTYWIVQIIEEITQVNILG